MITASSRLCPRTSNLPLEFGLLGTMDDPTKLVFPNIGVPLSDDREATLSLSATRENRHSAGH